MKKDLFFLFFSIKLIAQEIPISESSSFIYNKYNCEFDINNVVGNLFIEPTGELWCQPYGNGFFSIKNSMVSKSNLERESNYPFFSKVIQWNSLKYIASENGFYVLKKNQLVKKIIMSSNDESCGNFFLFNDAIYFSIVKENLKKRHVRICKYDGKRLYILYSFNCNIESSFSLTQIKNQLYFWHFSRPKLEFFKITNDSFLLKNKYNLSGIPPSRFVFKDGMNFTIITGLGLSPTCFIRYINGKEYRPLKNMTQSKMYYQLFDNIFLFGKIKDYKTISVYKNDVIENDACVTNGYDLINAIYSEESNSFYCGNGGGLLRVFPHIKKYPRLFNNTNSNSVFSLCQAQNGSVWAGSYNGNISIIDKDKVTESPVHQYKIMNGNMLIDDKVLLFGEAHNGNLLFSDYKTYKKVLGDEIFFCGYKSSNGSFYFGSAGGGLWRVEKNYFTNFSEREIKKITKNEGLENFNILSICEDKNKNIWVASSKGLGVYFPKTNKAITWLESNNNSKVGGSLSLIQDNRKTIWVASAKGKLFCYSCKKKYSINNLVPINHPLLNSGKPITFIHQWNDYLILGSKDKVLLFDLKKWYTNKIISVRYLNSVEINLTSNTEQNTIFTDNRDHSIWFSTSDMVYQWDIKKWLTLPTFKVTPNIIIKKENHETELSVNDRIEFEPTKNSFDIQISYQSKDNLPRFINAVLVKKGEKPSFENPNLQTKFEYKNLSFGEYIFYVRVCQQDGSFDVFQYQIIVESFLWQKWWFILLISFFVIGIVIYISQKRNQIEKQKKKLSQLNLSSLSNQFRPHFMLNALNSIGSQLRDKPHAEKVISRLGESINILYGFTKKNKFTISFANEWKLVENSIAIQQLLFIPNLDLNIKGKDFIPNEIEIPIGLLQIPIENALLHGLRNKTDGDCLLEIEFIDNQTCFHISIFDNGVGREKANKINKFKTNGTGLKTVKEMILIINQYQKNAISMEITDYKEPTATKVQIVIKKNIDYDKIKI